MEKNGRGTSTQEQHKMSNPATPTIQRLAFNGGDSGAVCEATRHHVEDTLK